MRARGCRPALASCCARRLRPKGSAKPETLQSSDQSVRAYWAQRPTRCTRSRRSQRLCHKGRTAVLRAKAFLGRAGFGIVTAERAPRIIGIPKDVIACDCDPARAAIGMGQHIFVDLHRSRVDASEFIGAELGEERNPFRAYD